PDSQGDSEAHIPWESMDGGAEQVESEAEAEPARPAPVSVTGAGRDALPDRKRSHLAQVAPASMQMPALQPVSRSAEPRGGGGWTLPMLCAGIALAACCVLIPQADANHRLVYDRQMLTMDLETVERQISVNQEFLKKVSEDPALAQRLAERQMKVIPEGTRVLELQHESDGSSMSPFQLVSVAPPPPLPQYRPVGGTIATLCYNSHTRLYVIAVSLLMMAMGLVLGSSMVER
ncbi:MAG TPA: hypothetical protein VN541_18945, partial [Tepidisphaeraceae bacterium]|nr:hypothetical protein [Tepidisphaeraceae bacterium]